MRRSILTGILIGSLYFSVLCLMVAATNAHRFGDWYLGIVISIPGGLIGAYASHLLATQIRKSKLPTPDAALRNIEKGEIKCVIT